MNSNGDVVVERNQFPITSMDSIRALKKQELLHDTSIPYCGYFTTATSNMHTNAIRYGHGQNHQNHQNQQQSSNRSRHAHHQHNFSRKRSPCILFTSRGHCTYGNNCKFLHEDGQDGPNIYHNTTNIKHNTQAISSFTFETPVVQNELHSPDNQAKENETSQEVNLPSINASTQDDARSKEDELTNCLESISLYEEPSKEGTALDKRSSNQESHEIPPRHRKSFHSRRETFVHPLYPDMPAYQYANPRNYNKQPNYGMKKWYHKQQYPPYNSNNIQYGFNNRHNRYNQSRTYPMSDSSILAVNGFRNANLPYSSCSTTPDYQQVFDVVGSTRAAASATSVPFHVEENMIYEKLSVEIESFIEQIQAEVDEMEENQLEAIAVLDKLVKNIFPEVTVDIYGSKYTKLALPHSDVDCVLISSSDFDGQSPIQILEKVATAFQLSSSMNSSQVTRVELLPAAKIPVLKIVFASQIMLDITCGHSTGHSGLSARDLIYGFQAKMPALQPLVLCLKSHLKQHQLNCAYTGGLSSYAIVLLTVRFLQACGDEHYKTPRAKVSTSISFLKKVNMEKSPKSNQEELEQLDEEESGQEETSLNEKDLPKWTYTFSRGGKVAWRTNIGNLLMLLLETLITFDYRHFGISVKNGGHYFLLPSGSMPLEPGAAVTPYISDPIKSGRNIVNSFRMHEVIQVWLSLYHEMNHGVSFEQALHHHQAC